MSADEPCAPARHYSSSSVEEVRHAVRNETLEREVSALLPGDPDLAARSRTALRIGPAGMLSKGPLPPAWTRYATNVA